MSHNNVTKVVWYILVQLSSLNNTMPMVSGVSVQVSVCSRVRGRARVRGRYFILLISLVLVLVLVLVLGCRPIIPLTPDTRNLKPIYSWHLKKDE